MGVRTISRVVILSSRRYSKVDQDECKMGFILSAEATKRLIYLAQNAGEAPHQIVTNAINTMFDFYFKDTSDGPRFIN